jgi:hypothetical protein
MKDIEELFPRVMEVCPACPEPTAIRHLRDSAIEFCRRTRVWRDYDSFPISTTGFEVVAADYEAQIYEITHASVTDDDSLIWDLEAKTMDWLDAERPRWRDEEGTPEYFTQFAPNTVRVVPKPDVESTLRLQLTLLPSLEAERLPDVLIDTYGQVIADGALMRILALPTDFAQPDLAGVHAAAFNDALNRWGDRVPRGQQRAKRRTKTASYF